VVVTDASGWRRFPKRRCRRPVEFALGLCHPSESARTFSVSFDFEWLQ